MSGRSKNLSNLKLISSNTELSTYLSLLINYYRLSIIGKKSHFRGDKKNKKHHAPPL